MRQNLSAIVEACGKTGRNPRVKHGELFATFHAEEVFLNNLTSPRRDNGVMTPEYKVVAVAVERVSGTRSESMAADVSAGGG